MEAIETYILSLKSNLLLEKADIERGFTFYTQQITNDFDRLTILIHLIMLQAGFKCHYENQNSIEQYLKLTKGSIYNKLEYNEINKEKSLQLANTLIITLIKSGKCHCDLNLKYNKFISKFLKINIDSVISNIERTINTFTNEFKDTVLNPFKLSIKEPKLINGITDLPVELLTRIAVKYLNIRQVVALMQTSKYFLNLLDADRSSCNSLWFLLFKRDWDKHNSLKKEWVMKSGINFRNDYIKNYKSQHRRADPFLHQPRNFRNFL